MWKSEIQSCRKQNLKESDEWRKSINQTKLSVMSVEENRGWSAQKHCHDILELKIVNSHLGWLENCDGTNCSMYYTHACTHTINKADKREICNWKENWTSKNCGAFCHSETFIKDTQFRLNKKFCICWRNPLKRCYAWCHGGSLALSVVFSWL